MSSDGSSSGVGSSGSKPSQTPQKAQAAPRRPSRDTGSGYAKGEETRRIILQAALAEFGERGYGRATTRRIAEAAGVALPSIAYHFGNKEGVYLACADEIVARYLGQMSTVPATALTGAWTSVDSVACRSHLKQLLRHVAQLVAGSDDALTWTTFVARELREQGPAFDVLYKRLWEPGVRILARLIAGIKGAPEAREADTIDALMLISSLVAFYTGRAVSMRTLGWDGVNAARLEELFAAADRLADGVRADAPAPSATIASA